MIGDYDPTQDRLNKLALESAEEVEREIAKTLAGHDVAEVIAVAVSSLVDAKITRTLYNLNLGGQPLTDPALEVDYNERLLLASLEELTRNK